jgi:hypothetical protein
MRPRGSRRGIPCSACKKPQRFSAEAPAYLRFTRPGPCHLAAHSMTAGTSSGRAFQRATRLTSNRAGSNFPTRPAAGHEQIPAAPNTNKCNIPLPRFFVVQRGGPVTPHRALSAEGEQPQELSPIPQVYHERRISIRQVVSQVLSPPLRRPGHMGNCMRLAKGTGMERGSTMTGKHD